MTTKVPIRRGGDGAFRDAALLSELSNVLHCWRRLCYLTGYDPEVVMAINNAGKKVKETEARSGVDR